MRAFVATLVVLALAAAAAIQFCRACLWEERARHAVQTTQMCGEMLGASVAGWSQCLETSERAMDSNRRLRAQLVGAYGCETY